MQITVLDNRSLHGPHKALAFAAQHLVKKDGQSCTRHVLHSRHVKAVQPGQCTICYATLISMHQFFCSGKHVAGVARTEGRGHPRIAVSITLQLCTRRRHESSRFQVPWLIFLVRYVSSTLRTIESSKKHRCRLGQPLRCRYCSIKRYLFHGFPAANTMVVDWNGGIVGRQASESKETPLAWSGHS